jgi:hypothetical protein
LSLVREVMVVNVTSTSDGLQAGGHGAQHFPPAGGAPFDSGVQ